MRARELWQQVSCKLSSAGVENAESEARWLLKYLGISLFAEDVSAVLIEDANALVCRRLLGVPLAYILGETDFMSLNFKLTPDVLIPRNDSECVVEQALSLLYSDKSYKIADLGTGSGALAIALAYYLPKSQVWAYDISSAALETAKSNARRLGVAERMSFAQADIREKIEGEFDLIISNPPYISLEEMAGLSSEVGCEPRLALTDEGDGLSFYRSITAWAWESLTYGGFLLFEIGYTQKDDVVEMLSGAGFVDIAYGLDGGERPRFVWGKKAD